MRLLGTAGRPLFVLLTIAVLVTPMPGRAVYSRDNGLIVLRLQARDASTPPPSIAGDFTNWVPIRMERRGNEWRFPVHLSSGVYRFAFRGADGDWFVPVGFPNRTDDGMGGWVAVLVIP